MRKGIEAAIEAAKEQHKRQLKVRRIEIARNGLKLYKEKKFGEAVKQFHTYLQILEDMKGVSEGQLRPSHFDLKRDAPEMMLISGVYWDLAKLYDRTQSQRKLAECKQCVEKFLLFSKGMPYEPLSTETLRRYVVHEKAVHSAIFKNAYRTLSGNNCYIATALMEEVRPNTIPQLRHFRDRKLRKSVSGRVFIWVYYFTARPLVPLIERLPAGVRQGLARAIDRIANWVMK